MIISPFLSFSILNFSSHISSEALDIVNEVVKFDLHGYIDFVVFPLLIMTSASTSLKLVLFTVILFLTESGFSVHVSYFVST